MVIIDVGFFPRSLLSCITLWYDRANIWTRRFIYVTQAYFIPYSGVNCALDILCTLYIVKYEKNLLIYLLVVDKINCLLVLDYFFSKIAILHCWHLIRIKVNTHLDCSPCVLISKMWFGLLAMNQYDIYLWLTLKKSIKIMFSIIIIVTSTFCYWNVMRPFLLY